MGQLTDLESLDTYDGRSRQLKQDSRGAQGVLRRYGGLRSSNPASGDRRGDGQANRAYTRLEIERKGRNRLVGT